MPDVNTTWKEVDDKHQVLKYGRVTNFSVSMEQPTEQYRSWGSDVFRPISTGPAIISFHIDGHIEKPDTDIYARESPHPDNHSIIDDRWSGIGTRLRGLELEDPDPGDRPHWFAHSLSIPQFGHNHAGSITCSYHPEPKPKRQYKRKEYEILVKHKDGHFTQDTFKVKRKRIGRINNKKRKRVSSLPK